VSIVLLIIKHLPQKNLFLIKTVHLKISNFDIWIEGPDLRNIKETFFTVK